MATRYRLGHHRKTRSFHIRGIIVVTLLVTIISASVVYFLSKEQFTAQESPGATYNVAEVEKDTKVIDEPLFSIELPSDWKILRSQVTPTIQYELVSTKRHADNRSMFIYIDTIPPNFPVSRLLPVTAVDNKLNLGAVSGRCSDFAGPDIKTTEDSNGAPDVAAKWNGVNFLCGLSYFQDYIIGTSSVESGVNKVVLNGQKSGQRTLFFVYIDQNITPDPSIFTDSLRTFTLK